MRRSHEHGPCIAPREHIDAEVLVVHQQRDRFNARMHNACSLPRMASIPRSKPVESQMFKDH